MSETLSHYFQLSEGEEKHLFSSHTPDLSPDIENRCWHFSVLPQRDLDSMNHPSILLN